MKFSCQLSVKERIVERKPFNWKLKISSLQQYAEMPKQKHAGGST